MIIFLLISLKDYWPIWIIEPENYSIYSWHEGFSRLKSPLWPISGAGSSLPQSISFSLIPPTLLIVRWKIVKHIHLIYSMRSEIVLSSCLYGFLFFLYMLNSSTKFPHHSTFLSSHWGYLKKKSQPARKESTTLFFIAIKYFCDSLLGWNGEQKLIWRMWLQSPINFTSWGLSLGSPVRVNSIAFHGCTDINIGKHLIPKLAAI